MAITNRFASEDYVTEKAMRKSNPTGTGSLSLNRKANTTIGNFSCAEGKDTTASGHYSHAEGYDTTASGSSSHAEGNGSTASGVCSHAEGGATIASGDCQHVQGKHNIEDADGKYAHIVGNGETDSNRSNAHTLDWSGNAWFAGDVYVGGTSQDDGTKLIALIEDETYAGCYYRMVDGVKEWVNPPMESGVAYKTTKRHMGKPVYVQCGDGGALPNNDSRTLALGVSGDKIDHIVVLELEVKDENGLTNQIPFIATDGEPRAIWYKTGSSARSITIKTFSNISNYTVYWYVEYTKA